MNNFYKNSFCLLFAMVACPLQVIPGWSWDQTKEHSLIGKGVHQKLIETSANNSVLASGYLENLGFQKGLGEEFSWQDNTLKINDKFSISKWLEEGAEKEDGGTLFNYLPLTDDVRYFNHFHDPLQPSWKSAGLDMNNSGSGSESALLWAQDSAAQSDPKWVEGGPGKDWSLPAIKKYFHNALTATDETMQNASQETIRQENFAKLFRGIGHQLHLLQDMTVPNHVRNDAHMPFLANVERWTNRNAHLLRCLFEDELEYKDDGTETEAWCGEPDPVNPDPMMGHNVGKVDVANYYPSLSITTPITGIDSAYSEVPLKSPAALFFDTDRLNSDDSPPPDGNDLATIGTGLAEYTNKNFISEETPFPGGGSYIGSRSYKYPSKGGTDLDSKMAGGKIPEKMVDEDGELIYGVYIEKSEGENIKHFASPTYLTRKLPNGSPVYDRTFTLDDKCYEDYAKLLLPRAVGYSAAFLDYFFRGKLEISQPLDGAYSVSTDPSQGFTTIKLIASNTSPEGEDLINGAIKLVVKFKTALNNTFEGDMPVFAANADFTYLVADEAKDITSILRSTGSGSPAVLTFNLPASIPLSATDLQLYLVYKGTLGNESDGIAVGYKDISEPTAFDVVNGMDWVCIDNAWHQTGLDAHKLSDRDDNGFPDFDAFPHNISTLNISLTSGNTTAIPTETTRDLRYENLATGSIARNYILADPEFTVNVGNLIYTPDMTEDIMWNHSQPISGSIPGSLTAVSVQEDTTYATYTNAGWQRFRGATIHNTLTIMTGEDTCNDNDPALPPLIFTPSINQ